MNLLSPIPLRRLTRFLVALAVLAPASVTRAADPVAGRWKITAATTLDGKPYTGTVNVSAAGPAYEVQWRTSVGNYLGMGLLDGERLCTGWGGKNFGVVLYHVNGDGSLDGQWTFPGSRASTLGTERATGGDPGNLVGTYAVKGTNPGGKGGYAGKLRIQKTGETYRLEWTLPGSPAYYGVGLKVGDSLHVGWGTDRAPYAVISYVLGASGDTAQGIWTVPGTERTATENLARE